MVKHWSHLLVYDLVGEEGVGDWHVDRVAAYLRLDISLQIFPIVKSKFFLVNINYLD